MIALVTAFGRFVLRHVLSFLLICCVLLLAQWGWAQWRGWQDMRVEAAQLTAAQAQLSRHIEEQTAASRQRSANLASAPLALLTQHIHTLDERLRSKQQAREGMTGPVLMDAQRVPFVQGQLQALRLDVEINLLQQERAYVQELRWRLQATQGAAQQRADLERLRQEHERLYAQWQTVQAEREALQDKHPVKCRLPVASPERTACENLRQQQAALLAANQRAAADHAAQRARVQQTSPPPAPLGQFEPHQAPLQVGLSALQARQAALVAKQGQHWASRLAVPVQQVVPTALLILLGVVLTPLGVKLVMYFVLAPLAQRRPPVRLLPNTLGAVTLVPRAC